MYKRQDKDNKVTNYELRNYGFKGMAAGGDKSNSLWIADFCPHPQKMCIRDRYMNI